MFGFIRRHDWKTAFSSTRKLLADKENTTYVFEIMEALRGDAMQRGCARMATEASGRAIMADRPDLVATLMDDALLARMPDGSLGQIYRDFIRRENISADGLIDAGSVVSYGELTEAEVYYGDRLRDQHDLWHLVTGYGRDGVGEACLVAFSYAQTRSLGFIMIGIMAGWKFQREFAGEPVMRAVWQAYRNGRKAKWLPAVPWEEMLDMPLEDIRCQLCIPAPTTYQAAERAIAGTGLVAA